MELPDDLNEYLRGDSELSREYRQESSPVPPQALDRRVLALLSPSGSRGKSPCLAPLAFAASVLLSMALVLAIVFGPQKARRGEDAPRLIRIAARADLSPAPVGHRLRLYSSDPPHPRTPSQWLADIAALRRAGRFSEADAENRRFRDTYPAYSTGGAYANSGSIYSTGAPAVRP
jgi:hypothetical protein